MPNIALVSAKNRSAPYDPTLLRAWADHEFYLAMRACGTRPTLAWLMWAAVRAFGGRCINQSEQEQANG